MNVRNWAIAVSVIVVILVVSVWSTAEDADRINATAGIAVAAGTVFLSMVTYFGIRSSHIQHREAQYATARPVLVPTGTIDRDKLWSVPFIDLTIKNVGTGVALNVSGVVLPPPAQRTGVPPQLSMQSTGPIAPLEAPAVRFHQGGTMFTEDDRVGSVPMAVPADLAPDGGLPSPYNRRYRAGARLTLTYTDVFHRKHAAVHDWSTRGHWASVAILEGVDADIDDMDAAKAPKPPAESPVSLGG
jgi:hypothetical protein